MFLIYIYISLLQVLGVLAGAMALLRRCRVNAALTIQLFSQLFHFVNVWAFNRIVAPNSQYCSRAWGLRLKARLAQVRPVHLIVTNGILICTLIDQL